MCPTLCDPIDGSPPGSPVPGILQARTLEWVAITFSNAGKWKWSHSVMSNSSRPHGLQPTRLLCQWDFPGKSTGVGCHRLLRQQVRRPWITALVQFPQLIVAPYFAVTFKIRNTAQLFPKDCVLLLRFLSDLCLYNSFHINFFWHAAVAEFCPSTLPTGRQVLILFFSITWFIYFFGGEFYKLSYIDQLTLTHGGFLEGKKEMILVH